jgi:hypothetical protein
VPGAEPSKPPQGRFGFLYECHAWRPSGDQRIARSSDGSVICMLARFFAMRNRDYLPQQEQATAKDNLQQTRRLPKR